jgi:hypothetical protein
VSSCRRVFTLLDAAEWESDLWEGEEESKVEEDGRGRRNFNGWGGEKSGDGSCKQEEEEEEGSGRWREGAVRFNYLSYYEIKKWFYGPLWNTRLLSRPNWEKENRLSGFGSKTKNNRIREKKPENRTVFHGGLGGLTGSWPR